MAKKDKFSATTEFKIKHNKKRKMAGWQVFLISFAVVVCTLFVAILGAFTYFKYIHRPISTPDTNDGHNIIVSTPVNNANTNSTELTINKNRYNFLILGCDRNNWLSDVIMIATYDVSEKSVSIMQIPRDTYVTVNNTLILDVENRISHENFDGKNDYGCKINAVLGHGGTLAEKELNRIAGLAKDAEITELSEICEQSFLDIEASELLNYISEPNAQRKNTRKYDIKLKFGIKYLSALIARSFATPIDFYAQVNLDGFVNIVDAIGGVDVYVQEDMFYYDPYQDLRIDISKGQQHLDGKKAEGFIRFRAGYIAADIARIDAQKIFMTAFFKKVLSLEGILNVDTLMKEVTENINTNLSFTDALYFATNALDVNLSEVVMLTMPGKSAYKNGISYYSIDRETLIEYVNKYHNKFNQDLTEEYFYAVEIAKGNDSTPPLTAEDITQNQPNLGFYN